MKLYMCKMYDSELGDWVDLGVFSSFAKANEAGTYYISYQTNDDTELIDWEVENNICTDYYETNNGCIYTRVITETELDKIL